MILQIVYTNVTSILGEFAYADGQLGGKGQRLMDLREGYVRKLLIICGLLLLFAGIAAAQGKA